MGLARRPVNSFNQAELSLGRVSVLEVDPDLGGWLAADEFARACVRCTAGELSLAAGTVNSWPAGPEGDDGVAALLVIRGLLSRKLLVEGRHAVELLGPGDLLQPAALPDDANGTLSL